MRRLRVSGAHVGQTDANRTSQPSMGLIRTDLASHTLGASLAYRERSLHMQSNRASSPPSQRSETMHLGLN